ncbi:hypothetical protein INT44_006573 [Umbelopsis vinacea]|uniref:Uncharacterized protein n=1 Tax=Umbelopsis vinacea TaxID=44442 RepID=A0A8H7PTR6_9FUNG|nr:hypothetical protein INT44_006573 [Umbelopsis vinacea]
MDIVYSRLNVLERIWSEHGGCSGDADGTSASSENARIKLKDVIWHINIAIQTEMRERRLLSAEIEDLMSSIDGYCHILGIQIDTVLSKSFVNNNADFVSEALGGWLIDLHGDSNPTYERRKALQSLDARLQAEVDQRWSYVNAWVAGIQDVCEELHMDSPILPTQPDSSNLSWATVQGNEKRYHFEHSMMLIHFYHNELNVSLSDGSPFDTAIQDVCSNIPAPSIIPTTPSDNHIYYNRSVPQPLSLKDDCLDYLSSKVMSLETEYRERSVRRAKLQRGIKAMWDELQVTDRSMSMTESVALEYLEQLQKEFDILHSLLRRMTDDYIGKYHDILLALWDRCMVSQQDRETFIESLHEQAETMDQVKQMVKDHIQYLQRIEPHSIKVFKAIKMRKTQIQKMVEFEKTASDPRRLFKSSFQLLEEEKWRKTCFPTLLRMEEDLETAVRELEGIMGKYFVLDGERFLTTLQREIAERDAQQTFFGFMDSSNQARKSSQDGYYSKSNDNGLESKSRMSRTSSGYSLSKLKMESPRNKDPSDDSTLASPMRVRFRNGSISSPGVPTRTMSTSILDRTDSASQSSKHSPPQNVWKGNPAGEFKPKIERSMSSMVGQDSRRNRSLSGSVSMQALTKPTFRNKRHSYDSVSSSDSDKVMPATPPLQRPSTIPELQDRLGSLEEL